MKISELLTEIGEPIGAKLKIAKDDDRETVLVDPITNTKTIIDKRKNPGVVQKDKMGQGVINVDPAQLNKPGQSAKPAPFKAGSVVTIKRI